LVKFTAQTGLQDVLQIEGYGVWWTLNAQRFVPGLTEVGNAFVWIDLLKAITHRFSPRTIVSYGQHELMMHLLEQIFRSESIQVVEENNQTHGEPERPPRKPLLLLARVLLGAGYLIYGMVRTPDACLFSNTKMLRRVTSSSGLRLRDVYLGDVARALRGRGMSVAFVEKYGWNASWKRLVARGFFFPSDLIYLLSGPLLRSFGVYGHTKKWHRRWREMCPLVKSLSRYRGCDISPWVLPLVAYEFEHHIPTFAAMTSLWKRILRAWCPEVLHINTSYGPAATTPIIAAKSLDIPTVEQQHGVIGKNHFAYLVPAELDTMVGFPLCDKMAVWGQYTKRLLIDHHVYEPDQLVITGFPRIDKLLEELPARPETLRKLGISDDRRVVLYTPNKFAQAFMSDILDSIRGEEHSDDTHWIIKLHPAVKTGRTWTRAIEERGLDRVTVVGSDFDFYALLAACDVHVSFASTTLLEAAVLGKPNVGLCTASAVDPAGYTEAGAFYPVRPSEVGQVAVALLHDEAWQRRLLKQQAAFARSWCLHDGKAVDRIVDLIESVVRP
jgi:hypothetical protein